MHLSSRYLAPVLLAAFLLGVAPGLAQARPRPLTQKPLANSYRPDGKIMKVIKKLVPLRIRRTSLARKLQNRIKGIKPDLVVVSDLHIGEGKVGPDRKYSALEDFRVGKHFDKFASYLVSRQQRTGRKMEFVLAGDTMDFLKVRNPPEGKSWPTDRKDRDTAPNETVAVLKAERIVQAHPGFFASLGKLLQAGHKVVLLPGNHDQELHFKGVQQVLRRAMLDQAPGARSSQVKFNGWLHVVGKAMVEHGHRFDSINNMSSQLHPFTKVDGEIRLRSAAGSYMVSQVVNPMKESIQGFDHMKPGLRSAWEVGRHLPKALKRVGNLMGQMADHGGPPTSADSVDQQAGHHKALEQAFTRQMAREVGKNLKAQGKGSVGRAELMRRVREFDGLSAEPYMEQLDFKGGKIRRRLMLLKPSQLKRWTRYLTLNNTTDLGKEYAITKLGFDVHMSGHTHNPGVAQEVRGRRGTYQVDTGTWMPRKSGGTESQDGSLTYAEVRQDRRYTGVRLRRWAPDRGYPVAFPGSAGSQQSTVDSRQ